MTLDASKLARKFAVARKTVYEWVKDGCPRNPDGSFDEEKVLAWRRAKLSDAANDPSVKAAGAKTALQAKRLMLQCEKLEVELLQAKGKLHDKAACAASLTELRARESHILHGLGQRFAAAFPEAAQQAKWIEHEIDGVIERLRDGAT